MPATSESCRAKQTGWILSSVGALCIAFSLARLSRLGGDGIQANVERQLGKTAAYVAGDYSIADIACFPWTMTHKAQGFTLDDYPHVKRWYAEVRARPQVQAGLAVGKFVKEPFDEEARKNMFGQAAKALSGRATQ